MYASCCSILLPYIEDIIICFILFWVDMEYMYISTEKDAVFFYYFMLVTDDKVKVSSDKIVKKAIWFWEACHLNNGLINQSANVCDNFSFYSYLLRNHRILCDVGSLNLRLQQA